MVIFSLIALLVVGFIVVLVCRNTSELPYTACQYLMVLVHPHSASLVVWF